MHSNKVRSTFLDYFKRNGHEVVASSSLIPYGDNTILFTNAGMNQFKNAFLGLEKRSYVRAATAQKVMRVSGKHNDIENIGDTKRHHTFFEMLGNFSFGDYFKVEAMEYALGLLEGEYGFERRRMWFTIYKDDDESYNLWQKVGIPSSRILRFAEKDNFWSMGATGPCGPNSEIHYFVGDIKDNDAKYVNSDDDTQELCSELWNLVFMQFNRTEDGKLHPLPQTGVDTGMGFERLVRLLQGGDSNYETDLFLPAMTRTQQLAHQTDAQRAAYTKAYRVIADHARASAFLIGDGVLPGNVGRNYVLRMIMRRAMRFGLELGLDDPFLFNVCETVIENMGDAYPELKTRREHILKTVHQEEERFARTLEQGLSRLDQVITATPGKIISGADAFKLYDTNGLPVEITRDIAKERGYSVDEAGFDTARNAAKDMARKASADKFEGNFDAAQAYADALDTLKQEGALPESGVAHNPYTATRGGTRLVAILRDGEMTDRAAPGETIDLILRDSAFYAESGGQMADHGVIEGSAWTATVTDVQRPLNGFIVHRCYVDSGEPVVNDGCTFIVDTARRNAIKRNHTATHLLQAALRRTLGNHVAQQGSLVTPERLRFDFSHTAPMNTDELRAVADWVNEKVLADLEVWDTQQSYKDAVAGGAMALFSEKYGDTVRVVRIGDEEHAQVISAELCGGTHVTRTGQIGSALVLSESAVASGVRRIELVTGQAASALARAQQHTLQSVARNLGAQPDHLDEHLARLQDDLSATQKQLLAARRELARFKFDDALKQSATVNGASTLVARVEATDADLLRDMTDWFRNAHPSGAIVLGAVIADKPALVVAVSADLNKKGLDAGKLIRPIAAIVGGGGGGRPNLAQAGGKDAAKLDEALAEARRLLADGLK